MQSQLLTLTYESQVEPLRNDFQISISSVTVCYSENFIVIFV